MWDAQKAEMRDTDGMDDTALVVRAKNGDSEAFNELVRRHRGKAFGVARSYARDLHMAEDIVQEALLRAFLHVSSLTEAERFVPWLQRIVRNQANTRLRRGGPFRTERPFSSYDAQSDDGSSEGSGLDGLLYQLSKTIDPPGAENAPLEQLMRREFFDTIRQLIASLKPHERQIFEAHFYRQMAPSEIAELLSISTDQVYKSISRSRAKLKDARFRMYIHEYVSGRMVAGQPESVLLSLGKDEEAHCAVRGVSGSSFAGSVYRVLRHAGDASFSLSEVMGLTGQAFRLNVETSRIDASGPTTYFWEPVFAGGLGSLGLVGNHTGDGGLPPSPYALHLGLEHIRQTVAAGRPVIAWDLFAPEFDLITGHDDTEMVVIADNGKKRITIPYERLGRGAAGGLFVLSIDRKEEVPYAEALRRAILAEYPGEA